MPYVLNLLYVAIVILASPWLLYAAVRRGKYREGYAEKLLGLVPQRERAAPCIWLHAVSVGEVTLLGVLVKELRRRRPDAEIVLSSTTRTGLELARKKYADLTTFYCPLDFSWACRRAMRRVRPSLLVLAELELWPNLIAAANEQGAKVAIVNGRLGERSWRGYRRIRFLVKRILAQVSVVAVQNDEYLRRFYDLGCTTRQLVSTGSLKYEGAATDRDNPNTVRLRRLAGLATDDIVFLAGSTQEGEEQAALETYRSLVAEFSKLRLVIVPRHAERFDDVARLLERSGLPFVRRSRMTDATPPARIVLVDAIGELGAWWGTAHVAFVGGSFGDRGGQNMIEPAAYGAAVSFGPNTWNFRDVVAALLAAEAAVVVRDGGELTAFVRRCLVNQAYADNLGRRARRLVAANLGATARTVDALLPLLPRPSQDVKPAAA
jgi:3-deoxy-D-manno-octulosonic-acid transferase